MKTALNYGVAALMAQLPLVLSEARSSALCCYSLGTNPLLEGKVYFPNTTQFDDRLESYWSVSAALSPTCMVLPLTADDVSAIIKTITEYSCPFGIRGGGHGFFALSNSVDIGVTIDFGYMNDTAYNEEEKIASIQPGGHWQTVYETLAPYGVTVTGARAGTVGVGGFVTGGGNSFHSASHGFACDNVQNFELVLANGTLVSANADENADLWRALKGGSGNFGLITRIDMYAIEFPDPAVPNIVGGVLSFDADNGTDGVIDAFVAFAENIPSDENSSSIPIWSYTAAGGLVLNVALENTLDIGNPRAFDGYLAAPGIIANTLRSAPMAEITEELGANEPYGYRNIWFTSAYDNDPRVLRYAVQKHAEISERINALVPADSGLNTLCMFQPLTSVLVAHGVANGGNVLGLEAHLPPGGPPGVMFLVTVAVAGAENEAIALPLMQEWIDVVDAYAEDLGSLWGWRYLNYASLNQDPIASFGPASVELLHATSAKYDPHLVFQKLRKSGFKIPT